MSSAALGLQQVPHGAIRPPAEVQVGFMALLQGRLNSAEPENAETGGNKTHKV